MNDIYSINLLMLKVWQPSNWCHECQLVIIFLNYTLNCISILSQHHPSINLALLHRCWFPDQLSIFIKQLFLIAPHRINNLSSHLCGDHDLNSNIFKLYTSLDLLDLYCHLTSKYCINIYIGVYFCCQIFYSLLMLIK